MQIDGISAIAVVVIASFAIDRIVTGILFGLSMIGPWNRLFPDPKLETETAAQHIALKKQKLLYFGLAALLAMPLLAWYGGVRIFSVLGFPNIDPILDTVVTGLILVAGADRIAGFAKLTGASAGADAAAAQPIEVTGKLVLQEEPKSKRLSKLKAAIEPAGEASA